MSKIGWGAALMSLGKSIPQIGQSFDEGMMNMRNQRMQNDELARLAEEYEREKMLRGEADQAYQKYQQSMTDRQGMRDIADTGLQAPDMTALRARLPEFMGRTPDKVGPSVAALGIPYDERPKYGPEEAVEEVPAPEMPYGSSSPVRRMPGPEMLEKTNRDLFMDSGLDAYREVDPRIKGIAETFENAEKKGSNAANDGLGSSSAAARLKFTQDNTERVQDVMERIEAFRGMKDSEGNPLYSSEQLDNIATKAKIDVLGGMDSLERMRRPTETAYATEEATRDAKAKTAYATSQAGESGKTAGITRMPDKERGGLEGLYGGIEELGYAEKLFDEKFVGPVAGRWQSVEQAFGTIGEDSVVFRESMQRFVNELIKARAGTAVSDQEFERIKTETFDFSLNPKSYKAKMKSNMEFLKRKVDRTLDSQAAANVDVSRYNRFDIGDSPVRKKPGGDSPVRKKPGGDIPTFNSVADAESASLKKGTVILINGRKAVVE